MGPDSVVTPATPTTIAATETMPSLAPSTPARSQLRRCAMSLWWGSFSCWMGAAWLSMTTAKHRSPRLASMTRLSKVSRGFPGAGSTSRLAAGQSATARAVPGTAGGSAGQAGQGAGLRAPEGSPLRRRPPGRRSPTAGSGPRSGPPGRRRPSAPRLPGCRGRRRGRRGRPGPGCSRPPAAEPGAVHPAQGFGARREGFMPGQLLATPRRPRRRPAGSAPPGSRTRFPARSARWPPALRAA